jgi:hypothetical protein
LFKEKSPDFIKIETRFAKSSQVYLFSQRVISGKVLPVGGESSSLGKMITHLTLWMTSIQYRHNAKRLDGGEGRFCVSGSGFTLSPTIKHPLK